MLISLHLIKIKCLLLADLNRKRERALLDQAGLCLGQGGDPSLWPGTPHQTKLNIEGTNEIQIFLWWNPGACLHDAFTMLLFKLLVRVSQRNRETFLQGNIHNILASTKGSWRLFYNCLLEDFLFFDNYDVIKIKRHDTSLSLYVSYYGSVILPNQFSSE